MLALEHSRRQQFADQIFDLEQTIQAPFPGLVMDSYDSVDTMINFHTLPYSYFDNASMFVTAPQSIKQEMPQFHEMPPALISSGSVPSIPSASSSTVGSPYSGPSHAISSQDAFDHNGAPYGLGVMPTIVNHDFFSQEMMRASMEADLSLEKLSDSYVGECADLFSSQRQASTVPPRHAPFVQHLSSHRSSSTSSPQLLSINTFLDPPTSTVSPVASSSVFSSVLPSPATEANRSTPNFKSPTTPASAYPRQHPTLVSPSHSRSFSPSPRPALPTRMTSHDSNAARFHKPASHFQSHFFAQSSGNFMPPLESSCSSLPLYFHVFHCPFLASLSFLFLSVPVAAHADVIIQRSED